MPHAPALCALVLAAAALAPRAADAFVTTGPRLYVQRPTDGEVVPTNTRIWLDAETATEASIYVDPREPTLVGPDGAVTLDRVTIATPIGDLHVYTPTAPLAPAPPDEGGPGGPDECDRVLASFRTAVVADDAAPELPTIDRVYTQSGFVRLDAEFSELLVVDRDGGDFDPDALAGELLAVVRPSGMIDLATADLPDAEAGLRFGVYDLAGNFSGWTEPLAVDSEEAGCRTVPRAPLPLLLAPLLALRRRRSPRP
jgi:hypothetical protein